MPSYPTALLYVLGKHGGLNFARLSSMIQRAKLSFLEKLLLTPEYADTGLGFVTREARARGDPVVPGSFIRLFGSGDTGWWLSSCIQWLDWLGIQFVKYGCVTRDTLDESIVSFSAFNNNYLSPVEIDRLNSLGIYTVGDLRVEGDKHPIPLDILQQDISLRIGQCWLIYSDKGWFIWEILSFHEYRVSIQIWPPSVSDGFEEPMLNVTVTLNQTSDTPAYQGVSSPYWLERVDFVHWTSTAYKQVFLS